MATTPYPVTYSIQRPERYNRLTVLFRVILAIPQLLIFSGIPFVILAPAFGTDNLAAHAILQLLSVIGLELALGIIVLLAWFAILFSGRFPSGLLRRALFIYRWQQNVFAYVYLLTDPYPPFGEGPYPLSLRVIPTEAHSRLTTFFRAILVIPHYIVLWFLGVAAGIVTFIAWFAILFTGRYPESMYGFSVGVFRWSARVCAYIYLFVDDYPPFSLSEETGAMGMQPQTA